MRKKMTAQVLALSAALILPGLAVAQFPYSAWDCRFARTMCSPALIPAPDHSIQWGQAPSWPAFDVPDPQFSDETVGRFVQAFTEIKGISQEYTNTTGEDSDREAAAKARAEAHEKALQSLEAAGIEREEYNQVAAVMNRELDLRIRVMGKTED